VTDAKAIEGARLSDKLDGVYLPPIHRLKLPKTTTQTALVRWLVALGYTVAEIHRGTQIRNQQVRNMATSQPKRASREDLPPLVVEVMPLPDEVDAILDDQLDRSMMAQRSEGKKRAPARAVRAEDQTNNEALDDENYNRN